MSLAKRIVSSFVSLTMVASTVGTGLLALPGAASAATLMSGDLIKASGPAVYYYGSDAKRYVFPNETTFFSWFMDFSSVKTISDSELAAISIGGNMTIRPGTKLVKITTDPKVYAVTKCGVLHWVESESVATSLFGSNWARRVVDVPDAFFVNYSVGTSVATAVHPNGSLISDGSGDTFVVWNGAKRKLVGAGMNANMYNAANVIPSTISYPAGADVTARESDLSDAACIASTGPVQTGMLTVSLASDTPAGATLPKSSAGSMLAKYNLTAGSSAVTVTGLRVHRVGVGAVGDFTNVYLYDSNGTRLTTGRTINSSTNTVEFNGLNVALSAGQTSSLILVGDMNGGTSYVTGGQHAFEIMDGASVITATTGTTIGGSFPVRGNTFVLGTASAARLDVIKGSTPADVNVGSSQVEISNFRLQGNSNDIEVRRITLFQGGDISNSDLRNFKLYQGATLVASADAVTGNGQIVLNFSPSYVIPNGNTRVFSLKADVMGRSGRTIKTYVEYSTDIYAVDTTYGSGAQVCIDSTSPCSSGTFDGTSSNFITLTTKGGQLTVAFNGPATQNVAKGQNGVVLYRFAMTSQASNLEVRKMHVVVGSTDGGEVCDGASSNTCTDDFIKNVRVRDAATGQSVQGPTSASGGTVSGTYRATTTINFTNSVYLAPGQTRNFEVVADLANSSDTGFVDHSYIVKLNAFDTNDIRVVDTGEYLATTSIVPASAITGNVMTVKAASLSFGLASTPSSASVVKKQSMVPALGISVQAGAQSDVLVTAVKVSGQSAFLAVGGSVESASAAANLRTTLSSCALYDDSTILSDNLTPDSSGVMNFTNLNFRLARGLNKTMIVKCTVGSVLGGSGYDTFQLGLKNGTADVTAQDQDSNTVEATVSPALDTNADAGSPSVIMTARNQGTVSVVADSMQQSTILVPSAGAWYPVAQFSASAQYEDMRIERILVSSTGDASSIAQVAIAKDGTALAQATLSGTVAASQDIDLSQNPIIVPKDNSVRFQLWAMLSNVQASSTTSVAGSAPRSGNAFTLGIAAGNTSGEYNSNYTGKFNIKLVGLGSGERAYAAGSSTFGNAFVVRKSKPTVASASTSSVLSNSSDFGLMTFTVGADQAGSISLKKVTLNFSKSTTTGSMMTLSNFRLKKAGEVMDSSQYTIVDNNGTDLSATQWQNARTAGFVVIRFTNPEVISGQGNEYSLRAVVSGALPGDSVSLGFATKGTSEVVTGFLTSNAANIALNSMNLVGPNLNSTTSGSVIAQFPGTFVWSDRSETTPGSATSGDWTDDLYVRRFDSVSFTR